MAEEQAEEARGGEEELSDAEYDVLDNIPEAARRLTRPPAREEPGLRKAIGEIFKWVAAEASKEPRSLQDRGVVIVCQEIREQLEQALSARPVEGEKK